MPEDDYFPPLPGGGGGGGGLIGAAAARRTNSPQHQQQGMRFQHSTSSSISSPTTPTGWGHHHHQQQQQQQQQLPNYNHRPQLSSASILSSSSRRLSTASHRFRTRSNSNSRPKSLVQAVLTTGAALARRFLAVFLALPPIQKALVVLALALALGFALVFLIYSHALFAALGPLAAKMRASSVGWVPVSLLIMATGFPPLIGYSTAVTIAGFVYGFPWGWPLAALSTVVGSTAAFLTSRGFLKAYVHGLVGKDKRFVALGQVLRRDGIGVLAMIRLCPLPYSLSNGFLATIGSIGPGRFAAATALTTPKLLVHVFIGSRLALLAESGDKMTGKDKMINYASMLIGGAVGFTVGLLIYRRTMARAAELAAAGEGGDQEDLEAGNGLLDNADGEDHHHRHAYNQSRQLVDPDELDAAHIMNLDDDDDDISLWDTTEGSGSYHDAWDGDGDGGGGGSETVNGTGIMAAAMKKKDMNGGIR